MYKYRTALPNQEPWSATPLLHAASTCNLGVARLFIRICSENMLLLTNKLHYWMPLMAS